MTVDAAIAVILRCHIALSVVIQSLRLSLSSRLFVIILLRRGFLYIQHVSIFLGLRLCFMFASFCSHSVLVISTSWCREQQFPDLSCTCLLVICFSFTSNIVIPAILLSDQWWHTSSFLFCSFMSAQLLLTVYGYRELFLAWAKAPHAWLILLFMLSSSFREDVKILPKYLNFFLCMSRRTVVLLS